MKNRRITVPFTPDDTRLVSASYFDIKEQVYFREIIEKSFTMVSYMRNRIMWRTKVCLKY